MKRLLFSIFIIIVLLFYSCESEKIIPGEAGVPVYLVPEIESSKDTLGCTFDWSFIEKPANSNLNVLSFQPSNNAYNIYFIPDVPGNYKVSCKVLSLDKKMRSESIFLCKIKERTNGEPPLSGTVADQSGEEPEADPIYLEDESEDTEVTESPEKRQAPEVAEKSTSKPTPPPSSASSQGLYTIQISSFKKFANAEKEMKLLKSMGLDNVYIKKVYIKKLDENWYRVRTNTFPNRAAAQKTLETIKSKYKRKSAWVDKIN